MRMLRHWRSVISARRFDFATDFAVHELEVSSPASGRSCERTFPQACEKLTAWLSLLPAGSGMMNISTCAMD